MKFNTELEIRKIVTIDEQTMVEGCRPVDKPLHLYAVAAVITNPWSGRYVDDLKPEIKVFGPVLGELLTQKITELAMGGDKIEAYGKAAIVGLDGEIEHGSALVHTLRFGNYFREAVGAKSYLSFTNSRGPANTSMMIPLMDKHDASRRSHYLTVQFSIFDAPRDDEIVIALGASNGGRPHHRIGDRHQDLKDLGHTSDNPADV